VGDLSVICGDFNVKPDSEILTILRSDGMLELVTHHWAEISTSRKMASGSYVRRFQLIDATHSANFSAGVWYCKVFLGRSLSCLATALSFAWLCVDKSVPFGKYCRNRRLVFSFVPRCHALPGSRC
jgi:hypothetical protein